MWANRVQEKYQPYANVLINSCDWSWTKTTKGSNRRLLSAASIADYQVFILCKVIGNDLKVNQDTGRLRMSPTVDIDEVWHQHLLRPASYFEMCWKLYQVKQRLDQAADEAKEGSLSGLEGKGEAAFSPLACVIEHTPESEEDDERVKYERFKVLKAQVVQLCPGYILTNQPTDPGDMGSSLFDYDEEGDKQEEGENNDEEEDDEDMGTGLFDETDEMEEEPDEEEGEGDPFTVTVRTLYGTRYDINNMYSNTKVLQLMLKVQESQGIPVDQQRLIFRGRMLTEEELLRDHNVVAGSVIDIVLKLRGC